MSGWKHDAKGRSTGKMRGRAGKRNGTPEGEPWAWLSRSMLESDAWRALGINARRIIDRLLLEHMAHKGTENGNLICTYEDFAKYGVTRKYIADAIRELEFFGFIRKHSAEPTGDHRPPNIYRLTWLADRDGTPATNNWKRITGQHVKGWRGKKKAKAGAHRQRPATSKNNSPADNCHKSRATIVA